MRELGSFDSQPLATLDAVSLIDSTDGVHSGTQRVQSSDSFRLSIFELVCGQGNENVHSRILPKTWKLTKIEIVEGFLRNPGNSITVDNKDSMSKVHATTFMSSNAS